MPLDVAGVVLSFLGDIIEEGDVITVGMFSNKQSDNVFWIVTNANVKHCIYDHFGEEPHRFDEVASREKGYVSDALIGHAQLQLKLKKS